MSKIQSYKKVIEKHLCLRYLMQLTSPGVVALINKKQKKIFIIASSQPLKSLATIMGDMSKELRKDKTKLSILVLDQCESKYLFIHKLKWIQHYKDQGYTLYNKEVLPQYEIKTRVLEEGIIEVGVVTSGKRWYVVKRSRDGNEVNEFLKQQTLFDILRMI